MEEERKFLAFVHTRLISVFISPARRLSPSRHRRWQANRESHRSYPAICNRRVYV